MTTTSDKTLLELAAKAAGLNHPDGFEWIENENGFQWNPLTDDGDALRLAVKLKLEIDIGANYVDVQDPLGNKTEIDSNIETCAYAATRRAIVRAAAFIGEKL